MNTSLHTRIQSCNNAKIWGKSLPMLLAIVITSLLVSCGTSNKSNEEAILLYNESMRIHDEVMPRMDEMFKVENGLKALRDSLAVDTVANASRLAEINTRLTELDKAGKGMMDWMHNIQDVPGAEENKHSHHSKTARAETLTDEQVLKIQQNQKAAIEQVKMAMESSIDQGKALLKTN